MKGERLGAKGREIEKYFSPLTSHRTGGLVSLFTLHFSLFTFLLSCQDPQAVKRDQYLAEGFGLYQQHCANCHGKEGKGLAGLYPPMAQEYLKDKNRLSVWTKHGIQDSLQIDGKLYVRPMPGNPALKDLEIAEIITYVTNTFGEDTALWPTDSVVVALRKSGH